MAAGDDRVSVYTFPRRSGENFDVSRTDIPGELEAALEAHLQGLSLDASKYFHVLELKRNPSALTFVIFYVESA